VHFAHVVFTFESLWAELVPSDPDVPLPPNLSPEVAQLLRNLRPDGMARSPRLKQDLAFLHGAEGPALDALLSRYPGPKVQEYCSHIRTAVTEKPHTLLAYAWCYYMAVFSGGRWIRGELMKGDEEFWRKGASVRDLEKPQSLENRGLAFWNFDGTEDGEDIKMPFRAQLSAAHELFTPEQIQDIILESQEVFNWSAKLVEELDERLGTDLGNGTLSGQSGQSAEKQPRAGAASGGVLAQVQRSRILRRPEVAGAAVILAFMAFIVLLGFDPRKFFL
jgi:heme oxygenase